MGFCLTADEDPLSKINFFIKNQITQVAVGFLGYFY